MLPSDAEPCTIETKNEEFFAWKSSESILIVLFLEVNAIRRTLADHHRKIRWYQFSEYSVLKVGLYFSGLIWPSPKKSSRCN